MPFFIAACVTYVAVFVGLRFLYERQELLMPDGHHQGLDLLQYNLLRAITWRQLIATLSIIPICSDNWMHTSVIRQLRSSTHAVAQGDSVSLRVFFARENFTGLESLYIDGAPARSILRTAPRAYQPFPHP